MKKFFASVGLAALGASTLQAQYAPGITPDQTANPRGWSVAAALRGFYDDNYLTLPNGLARSSYGTEVSPSATFNHTVNNTTITLSYVYDWRYYETTSTSQSSHQFNGDVKQNFSERFSMRASDSFVIAQEPTVIDTAIISSPLYTEGNNVHNTGTLSATAGLTPKLDLQASYANNLYAYEQTFGDVYNPNPAVNPLTPSRSAILDRMEQLATLNLNWKILSELTGVLGYSYGHVGYTSPEPIIFAGAPPQTFGNPANVLSKIRDNDSHFFFVGADEAFTSQLNGSIRVGGEYLDYYNVHSSDTSPYVDASLTWTYMKESYLQSGVMHQHSATDVTGGIPPTTGPNAGKPVLDAETTAAYLSVNQKIAGGFTGGLLGQFQHSAFNGGTVNSESEDFFIVGMNFAYRFTPYFGAEAGYNWNKLVSDVSGRDYTRNMVYLGVRATY
ncbi:MAG: outer membrane beta-barrel protein [Verrucomicrobiota bacterium]|jgi:hypothetical protein